MLPTALLVFAALVLMLALVAFWQSVRALFGQGVDEISAAIGGDRAGLVDEKNALLRALKDIEFERAVGKISDADWKRLDASYRARAKDVLAELDKDLGPWREKAEKLVRERLGKSAHTTDPDTRPNAKALRKAKAKSEEPVAEAAAAEPVAKAAEAESVAKAAEAESVAKAAEAAPAAKVTCPGCSALNDSDAVFCKKCAVRLAASEKPPSATEEAS